MHTLPTLPAQIHVPDVTATPSERRMAAKDAAQRMLGLGLVSGAFAVPIITFIVGDPTATTLAIPGVWLFAVALAALSFALTMASASVDVTPRSSSRALLFAGLALVGPLTLHGLLQTHLWAPASWLAFGGRYEHRDIRTFASWQHASLILAGPSHIVFAVLSAIRGQQSMRGAAKPKLIIIGAAASAAALWCCIYGCYGLLPVAYVGVTSVPVLLLMRHLERR